MGVEQTGKDRGYYLEAKCREIKAGSNGTVTGEGEKSEGSSVENER